MMMMMMMMMMMLMMIKHLNGKIINLDIFHDTKGK